MKEIDKLIRDNMPEILDKKGIPYKTEVSSGYKLREYIIKKIIEEVQELIDADKLGDKDKIIGEIVDVTDIIKKYCKEMGINEEEIEKVRTQKNKERGGFDKGIILKKLGNES
ncbi:MAG: nucleoside triphosphate pyrophosphohydrolase [Candidatus Gracilibacteria bacterium]|nr:nucleoside triphosphate pyrophosphohydrolase [Candidatus Gracilibacteria bacterium]